MSFCCNINFQSQFCYINGEPIHVLEYIKQNTKQKILCQKGHTLVLANGTIRKPHFRHKNSNDVGGNPMTEWHCEWQGNFVRTEEPFLMKPEQIKERRADVVLNATTVLEIQHSSIDRCEVDNRLHDYQLHGVQLTWVIDGNGGSIAVNKLEYSNRVYLEFISDFWKYESFMSYDTIFIDIDGIIYKINPKKVKSRMVDAENGQPKQAFIESLKTNTDIWTNEEPMQCNLFIRQQGAGNGKTYGIIRMLEDDVNSHYKTFIYITKQHSAKHIIKTEFENQQKNFRYLTDITIIESPDKKKYIIKYFNIKSNMNCQIIIATIDAFTWSIGNKNHKHLDKFEGLIYSIIDEHIETKKCGTITFGGVNPKLNKETLLVIDEFQDPPEYYAQAIIKIMLNTYIDAFIVGDRLQSISNEQNAFTYFWLNEFPSINTIKLEPTNICRRFIHPKLVDFVNFMIPFDKYSLPPVTPYGEYNGKCTNPLEFITRIHNFIDAKSEKNNYEYENKITDEVENIMAYYEKEVIANNRVPEDFLLVTPFTKNNPLVNALTLAINVFWKNKFSNDIECMKKWKSDANIDEYYRYAIFHKSEDGSSIDLSESEYSTRIVSCHSSKGDGRKIVFIVEFSEGSLKCFSHLSNNLVYDSLLHVGLTRMKEKLYICYANNNDDIAQKINEYQISRGELCKELLPTMDISNKIKYIDIIRENARISYELFNTEIIQSTTLEQYSDSENEKKIVDMGNHNIRYSSLLISIYLEIINKEQANVKHQLKKIFHKVCSSNIKRVINMNEYFKLLHEKPKDDIPKNYIPILKVSDKGRDYLSYFDIIYYTILHVQSKMSNLLRENTQITLCPLECIILHYMIEIVERKIHSSISIIDVYDIVDIYSNSFSNECIGHETCLCKTQFCKVNQISTAKVDKTKLFLKHHFEQITKIKTAIDILYSTYPNISWLVSHPCKYNGNGSFDITNIFKFIGYDNETVVICYVKPQFNSLNYNETLLHSILDTHFIHNTLPGTNNYERFTGKKAITCILTLDREEPYYIEWKDSEMNNIIITKKDIIVKQIQDGILEKYKQETNGIYYFYTYWRTHCPEKDKTPLNFMAFLQEKLEKLKDEKTKISTPSYIYDFFKQIEFELNICKSNKKKELILQTYDDKCHFSAKLHEVLETSVKRYLGMSIDEEDSDDE